MKKCYFTKAEITLWIIVEIIRISKKEHFFMWILALIITAIFYFILKYFNTANLALSTVSVTTSFLAVYLTFRRNPCYTVGYAANDIVLVALWALASMQNSEYISVAVCFAIFFANDIYGFANRRRIEKRQAASR